MKPLTASIHEKNRRNLISVKGKKQSQLFGVTSLLALAACSKQGTSSFRDSEDTSTFDGDTPESSPTIVDWIANDRRATNHSNTTIDLTTAFANSNGTLTYDLTASAGVSTANSALTLDYDEIGVGTHTFTVTATDNDAENADAITEVFVLVVVKLHDNSLGSDAPLLGTNYDDAITGNSFSTSTALTNTTLTNIDVDGGDGNDTISSNTINANDNFAHRIAFVGGAGNDTISSNTFTAASIGTITFVGGDGDDTISDNTLSTNDFSVHSITFVGGAGNDTISNNSLTGVKFVITITFDGGDGNDTISSNTLSANDGVMRLNTFDGGNGNDTISDNLFEVRGPDGAEDIYAITLMGGAGSDTISSNNFFAIDGFVRFSTIDGGDGNDTISDNHIEAGGTDGGHNVTTITLMGGAGDDVFSGNTATQANGELSSITIDGEGGKDKVYFDLASSMFTINSVGGGYGSNITVTDNAKRTEASDGVDSYAEYELIDIEELYFDSKLYEFS